MADVLRTVCVCVCVYMMRGFAYMCEPWDLPVDKT